MVQNGVGEFADSVLARVKTGSDLKSSDDHNLKSFF